MKNFKYCLILFTFFLSACSLSVDDLTKQVKQNMQDELKQKNISITSLVLTKKGGNEYSGILKTLEPNGDFTYTVEVIYDGKSFTWKVTE